MALEQRTMYDGAAVATAAVVDASHDNTTTDAAAAQADAAIPVAITSDAQSQSSAANAAPQPGDEAVAETVRQVVFIDSAVEDKQTLLDGLRPGEKAYVLDAGSDGVQQIADIIARDGLHDLSAIQIVSHGQEAQAKFGVTMLTQANLSDHAAALAQIGAALTADGDILLYGCDIAADAAGQQFIAELSRLTGADVAASTDATGSAAKGGDWTLEATTGAIEAATPFSENALASYSGLLANIAPTFSVYDGITVTDVAGGNDVGYSVSIQADGKIVVMGSSGIDFAAVRYNTDGTLDTSFSGDGKATVSFGSPSDGGSSGIVQPDGKILVAGTVGSPKNFGLARFNADGTPDTTFDGDGKVTTAIANYEFAYSIALQPDGKILVAGAAFDGPNFDFALVRYNSDGSLDTSFAGDGIVTTGLLGTFDFSLANSVTVQADGKILVAGFANSGNDDLALARYNADGTLDGTFSGDGKVVTAVSGGRDRAYSVTAQPDGKILVAGYTFNGSNNDFALVRYNADGSLDATFGNGGEVTTGQGLNNQQANSVALQPDGKILVAGFFNNGANQDFGLVRYNTDGSLDTSFGTGGIQTTAIGTNEIAYSIAVQADGKIVVSGSSDSNFAVVRYNADGSLDTTFGPQTTLDNAVAFTEGGTPVVLDSSVQIFDAELAATGNYSGATVTLARSGGANADDAFGGGGVLSALTQGGALVVSGTTIGSVTQNSGGTLILTFNANATQSLVNAALSAITYANTSDAPPASTTINWTFSDGNSGAQGTGGALTAAGSTTVTITAVNDAPGVVAPVAHYQATEETDLSLKNTGLSVSDIDAGSADVTATLSVTQGVLRVGAGTSGATVSGSNTSTVTITGTIAEINALLNSNATSTVVYNANTGTPAATSTLTLTVHDNGNTGGGDLVASTTATIDVTAVNNAPAAAIAAVATVTPEILVNTATANSQSAERIVTLTGGRFVIVWSDGSLGAGGATGDTSGTAIKAQVFEANGTKFGGEILVNTAVAGNQLEPQVAALTNGDFVVTWTDNSLGVGGATGDASSGAVKAQLFDANGTKVGGEIRVNTVTGADQSHSMVAALANGGFVVGWAWVTGITVVDGTLYFGSLPRAQVFDATGAKIGSEIAVSSLTQAVSTFIPGDIEALSDGGFVMSWNNRAAASPTHMTYVQKFDAAGVKIGAETRLGIGTTATEETVITALSGGGYAAAWWDGNTRVQVFDASGAVVGIPAVVNSLTLRGGEEELATLDNGGFVLVAQSTADQNVYMQLFNADGTTLGTATLVSVAGNGADVAPRVAVLSNGVVLVTWTDGSRGVGGAPGDQSGTAIKGRLFASDGAPLGGEFLVNSAVSGDQSASHITALAGGNFAVTWVDGSGGAGGAAGDTSGTAIKMQVFRPLLTAPGTPYVATENTDFSLKGNGLSVVDGDGGSGIATATLSVAEGILMLTAGTSGATVVSGNGTSSVVISGTIDQINALLNTDATSTVVFNLDAPAASVALTLTIDDNGNTGSGGALTGTASGTISVTAVNDAPVVNANAGLSLNEGTSVTITAAQLDFNDVEQNDTAITYTITTAAAHGTLYKNGVALGAGGTFTQDDINNNRITYTHDGSEAASDSFAFSVSDGEGGSVPNQTFGFTVTAVNDAPTFTAGDGKVVTVFGGISDSGLDAIVQPDGKIVFVGYSSNGSNKDIALARYNADGSLDTSFGVDGKVTTAMWAGDDVAQGVALQADGKIVVAGYTQGPAGYDFALLRYNADGSLDATFGSAGKVTTEVGVSSDFGYNVAVQPDGKILVGGYAFSGGLAGFALVRYNTDGSLDTSFSGDGKVITVIGSSQVFGIALQPDGKILLIGTAGADIALVRYNADGSLDTGFDGDGYVVTSIYAGGNTGSSVTVQPDGKILVAGTAFNGTETDFVVIRYNSDGSFDTSFGDSGKVVAAIGSGDDTASSIALQPDGKILVGGYAFGATNLDFAVARYNADGSLDTSFGSGGRALTAIGTSNDRAYSLSLQSDGKIVLAGTSSLAGRAVFALVRYNADGSIDSGFDPVNTLDGAPAYVENGAAVVLDSSVAVFDAELAALNNYGNATLTLARAGGPSSQDVFGASGVLSALTQGGALVVSGTTIGAVTQNSGGTLVLTFNGNATQALVNAALSAITYANNSDTPPATAEIAWTFSDGNSGAQGAGGALTAAGSTTVTITAVNDAPVAAADSYAVDENAVLTVNAAGVLVNDTDADTNAASWTAALVQNVAYGTLVLNADGSFIYTPNANYNGSDSFTYKVNDGAADSNTVTVNLTVNAVNEAPVAVADSYTAAEDTALVVAAASGVLDNDTDADNDSLTAVLVQNVQHGTLTLNADGSFTYTPNANYNGSDSFTYKVNDGAADSGTVTVNLTVTAVNDAPTFDVGNGTVITSVGSSIDIGQSVIVQSDGKILVAGYSDTGFGDDFALVRYNADGSLDTSFGGGDGKVTTPIALRDNAHSVAVQADGKIVVAGFTFDGISNDFAVVRYNVDGSLDASFGGGDGIVTTAVGSSEDVARSVTLQSDGKILVAGHSFNAGTNFDFALVRYNVDGSLDAGFGAGGKVTTSLGSSDSAYSVKVQADGKILVAGSTQPGSGINFGIVRYNSDGSLDATFGGGDGIVTTAIGSQAEAYSLAVQSDGMIVVAGYGIAGGSGDFALVRYDANGNLDTGFGGGDGIVTTAVGAGTDFGRSVVIQPDGKILVVGLGTGDFSLVRYNADGSLDASFGAGGKVSAAVGPTNDFAYSVVLQSDGKIVVAGSSSSADGFDFSLARFNADGSLDASFGAVNTLDGAPAFTEGGAAVVLDSSVAVFDAELAALNNFGNATLTLARAGGASSQDVFGASGVLSALTQGGALVVSGTTIGAVTQNSGGTLVLTFNGSATQALVNAALSAITYANTSDAPPATAEIAWTFSDGNNGAQGAGGALAATGSTTVTITAVNDAPVAAADSYAVDENSSLNVAASGVLANDTDADTNAAALTAVLVNDVQHGTLTLNGDGSFTYTPDANYDGLDSFTYKVNDGTADSNTVTVSLTISSVNEAPIAVADSYIATEDTALVVAAASGVLDNDTDADNDSLTAVLVQDVQHGTLTLNADGSFTYTPDADYASPDSFTYQVNDGAADSNIVTVNLTVNPINDSPVAVADAYSVNEDGSLSVNAASGVRANDTDIESTTASLTVALVDDVQHGTLTLNADGSFTYTPDADYAGPDSFTYQVNDGAADSNIVTVNLTVNPINDSPVAVADAYSVDEDGSLSVNAASGVRANDTDIESTTASLTVALVDDVQHGTLTLNADGSFTYTPDADYAGPDSFTCRVNDGAADSNIVTVNLTVNPINDAPVAVADAYSVDEDGSLSVNAASGVRANDTDIESATGSLSVALVDDVQHGTLTLNSDGSFTYTPDADYAGPDSFTYQVNDGVAASSTVTVDLTVNPVNDAPVAVANSYTAVESTPLVVAAGQGVLVNDGDIDTAHGSLTATLVEDVAHGSLTLNADGSFTYTPDADYNGPDSFTYRASDGALQSGTVTVTLTVNSVNNVPVAVADSYAATEDTALIVAAGQGVLANDTDIDSPHGTLQAELVDDVAHGTLTLNTDGSFTYIANANYNGPDSFTYKTNDGLAESGVVTVNLTVNAVNDAPVAVADAYSVNEDGSLGVNAASGVRANDTDIESATGSLSVALVDNVQHGTLTLNADGSFIYTPDADYAGPDSFTYMANDGAANSSAVTVTLTVTPVNDAPVAVADSYSATESTTLTVDAASGVLANDSDIDTLPASRTAILVDDVAHGTLTLNADGSFTYTPDADYNGPDSFTYKINDGALDSGIVMVTLSVSPVDNTPVAVVDSYSTNEDTPLTVDAAQGVLANDTDIDTPTTSLTATLMQNVQHGTLTLNPDGSFTYAANTNYNGLDSFTYKVNDGTSESNTVTVNLTVNAVNDAPVAVANSYTATEDTTLTVNAASGVLANDDDIDSGSLTAALVQDVAHGTLTLNADGSFTYAPDADYTGPDSFAYTANDGAAGSNTVTVTLTVDNVNDAPAVGANAVLSVNEGASAVIGGGALDFNDLEQADTAIAYTVTSVTANGALFKSGVALGLNGTFTQDDVNNGRISYTHNGSETTSDSFGFTVRDGAGGIVAGQTFSFAITPVNDVPVASIVPAVYSALPGATLDLKSNGLSVADVDGNGGSATVTLSVTEGALTVTAGGSGATVSGSGTSSVTITGSVDAINALLADDATSSVSFVDNAPVPSAAVTLTLTIEDNGNTGGGNLSSSDTAIIGIDAPPAIAGAGNTVGYTEQQASPAVLGAALVLSDADAPGTGAQINGATVAITGGGFTGDVLAVDTSGTSITASYNAGTGTLTLTGADTLANYQAVLRQVTFSSTSDNPTNFGANAARTVAWSVSDIYDVAGAPVTTTVNVTAVNDAASLSSTAVNLIETDAALSAGGALTVSDVDGTAAFATQSGTPGSYGAFSIAANGAWTYTANSAHNEFVAGVTYTDTFDAVSADGTHTSVTVNILGTNDAATVGGLASGAVTEAGGLANAVAGTPTASGTLTATDPDNAANSFQAVASGASTDNGYGSFAMSAGGVWTYTLDNAHAAVQALNAGDALTDTFTVLTADGTSQQVTVTINGANDAAAIAGTTSGAVIEAGGAAGTPVATGTLTNTDVDNAANTFQAIAAGTASDSGYGSFAMSAGGAWTYTLDNGNTAVQALNAGQTLTDSFTVRSADGTAQAIVVTIAGANDAAVVAGDTTGTVTEAGGIGNATAGVPGAAGTLTAADVDNADDTFEAATIAGTYGSVGITAGGEWTYTLDDGNAAVQALNAGGTLTDTITVRTADGTTQVLTVTINGANDTPVVTAGNSVEFDSGSGTEIVLAPSIALADADDTTLAGATVTIDTGLDLGDQLIFTDQNGIVGVYNSGTGTLTLTGVASLADYRAALASVRFFTGDRQDGARTISWTVDDGRALDSLSAFAITQVTITSPLTTAVVDDAAPNVVTDTTTSTDGSAGGAGRIVTDFGAPASGASGGPGSSSVFYITTDLGSLTLADGALTAQIPLPTLSAPLGGDIASVQARLASGEPLPGWLRFDPATGRLTADLPTNVTASLLSGPGTGPFDDATASIPSEDLINPPGGTPPTDAKGLLSIEIQVRDSKGNISILNFMLNVGGATGVPGKQGALERQELDLRVAPGRHIYLAYDRDQTDGDPARATALSRGDIGDKERGNDASGPAPGRAGLSQQLAAHGWRAMHADRLALLNSLHQPTRR